MMGRDRADEKVAVVGVAYTPIRRSASSLTSGSLALRAVIEAASDAGLLAADIDGLATYPEAPEARGSGVDGRDFASTDLLMTLLSDADVSWFVEVSVGGVLSPLQEAVLALRAGACKYAAVWRSVAVRPRAEPSTVPHSFSGAGAAFGCDSLVQWHAMRYMRYLNQFGRSREDMAPLVCHIRAQGSRNPDAVFRGKLLDLEEYMAAPMVSDPLSMYDCDMPVNAAVALILTTHDRARDLPHRPAVISPLVQQTWSEGPRLHYTTLDYTRSGRRVADRLWAASGVGPGSVDAVQIYDGFSPSVWYWLEAAGFCGEGEAADFVTDHVVGDSATLPLNTGGGSLGQGRLIGMNHVAEAVLQVMGRCGDRQLDAVRHVAVFDGSPMTRAGALMVSAEG